MIQERREIYRGYSQQNNYQCWYYVCYEYFLKYIILHIKDSHGIINASIIIWQWNILARRCVLFKKKWQLRRSEKVWKVAFAAFGKLFFISFLIFRYVIFSIMIITVYKESIFSTFRFLLPLPEKENNSFFFWWIKMQTFHWKWLPLWNVVPYLHQFSIT